ncbi:hypothetical protein ATO10_01555 [Actibacterium atlanticum]|uniref:Carboxylesterase n=1 Tax=Actibacterium atlanticum TaxID=1461693 RepID=A0A058ZRC0_9RHOB|nr:holin family protein [Actibacterium atlanticum]KCV83406.1 hypothetical protein ATO10_01555 [Actibacterium atlanticum]
MGLIENVLSLLFGPQKNAIRETVEVFRVNAEAADTRDVALQQAVLQQFGTEFTQPKVSLFDTIIDGINRLPRPMLALGTIGLFVSAMANPIWFAERMQGISLVPEPMWWIMGAIISFYFGARHQLKGQQFQRSIAESMARVPVMTNNMRMLRSFEEEPTEIEYQSGPNPALSDWRAGK